MAHYPQMPQKGVLTQVCQGFATAIESGDHLLRCIVYIDLNMVRAGVVNHPSDWDGR